MDLPKGTVTFLFAGLIRWIVFALACSGGIARADLVGRLHFRDLPPETRVYADGKPVPVRMGTIALAPGWHEVQVESMVNGAIQAYWRPVKILLDHTIEMPVVWHRVLVGSDYHPIGSAGPAGPQGPPARPYQPLPEGADIHGLIAPLQEARDRLLDDFTDRLEDRRNAWGPQFVPVYAYTPEKGDAPYLSPPGPSGEPGPPGPPGLPAEINLIQTQTGEPLMTALQRRLGLDGIERILVELDHRRQTLSMINLEHGVSSPPFHLLTARWRAPLEQRLTQWRSLQRQLQNHPIEQGPPGAPGPPGPPGPRGPDGSAPPGATAIRLDAAQTRQVLDTLASDRAITARLLALQRQVEETIRWEWVNEGEHLALFPPPELRLQPPIGADRTAITKPEFCRVHANQSSVVLIFSWFATPDGKPRRYDTPAGPVTVQMLSAGASAEPPLRFAGLTLRYTDVTFLIETPASGTLLAEFGDGPHHTLPWSVQVDGRKVDAPYGNVNAGGGRHRMVITYPDIESL